MDGDTERYSRNIGLFGEAGQRRLATMRVAVVGLGGLGSHVAQQTAYLGVRRYVLVDNDIVTLSNLNRLIGAVEADVERRTPKVQIAERLIRTVNPAAATTALPTTIDDAAVQSAILQTDVLFGCVDNDVTRLKLTEISALNSKPYIDLATDTGENHGLWYGGRVLFAHDGELCLSCAGELDQRELALASMTPAQREEDRKVYGVPFTDLQGTGPAVVSVNGVVASLAVTEFMVWATGLRKPNALLRYRGDLGGVSIVKDRPKTDCYYCSTFSARRSE